MADPVAVTNTSPVIALVGIGQLALLDSLFDRVVVPFEVWDELSAKPGAPEPAQLQALARIEFRPTPTIPAEAATLDAGERAAIALAASIPGAWVLLDEIAARRVADGLRIPVRGTLGVLAHAKRQGLIPLVGPLIERMVANGCRFAPGLVVAVLSTVGE